MRDGEVIPACAQTCPTDALVFGNLRDPESRVSRLIQDPRAYQVFEHLNTKPGVIYLKKVITRGHSRMRKLKNVLTARSDSVPARE